MNIFFEKIESSSTPRWVDSWMREGGALLEEQKRIHLRIHPLSGSSSFRNLLINFDLSIFWFKVENVIAGANKYCSEYKQQNEERTDVQLKEEEEVKSAKIFFTQFLLNSYGKKIQ